MRAFRDPSGGPGFAEQLGHKRLVRAVGRAVGSNPLLIIAPCHRVVGATGKLTGYAGGLDRKLRLLELEEAPLVTSGRLLAARSMTKSAEPTPLEEIRQQIASDPSNARARELGYLPLFAASAESAIAIIGQAPGRRAQLEGEIWDDPSAIICANGSGSVARPSTIRRGSP